MSWMEKLYQTYEAAISLDLPAEKQLTPISHISQKAHINIVIDGEGNFRRASVLEKNTQIFLPATEKSATGKTGKKTTTIASSGKITVCRKRLSFLWR